jgi:large-conductance mechanosensitive channel
MQKLKENTHAVIDLGVVLSIGIAFAALMVIGFIIWKVRDQLIPAYPSGNGMTDAGNTSWNTSWRTVSNSMNNITGGFDNAINLILVAITIFILAIAISALLMLRGRQ